MPDCPTTPEWTSWTPWSECDVLCGEGVQTRYRECNDPPPLPGQMGCLGIANETVDCSMPPCECVFDLTAFTNEFGYQPAEIIGWVEKDGIPGPTSENELVRVGDQVMEDTVVHVQCNNCTCEEGSFVCTDETCENCTFTSWSEWTPCSKTCDVGQRSRDRELLSGSNLHTCTDPRTETQDCNTQNCQTEEPWSTWNEWSNCTSQVPCIPGSRTRTRECPANNIYCVGDAVEIEPCGIECNEEEVNCTDNRVWSDCAFTCPQTCKEYRLETFCTPLEACLPGCTCMEGYVTASDGLCIRQDDCPCYDENGNAILPGFSYSPPDKACETCTCTANHTLECTTDPACCEWDNWGAWGDCSVTCGAGTRNRYRSLISGNNCGSISEEEPCEFGECPPGCTVDGVDYEYGDVISDDFCTVCYCTVEISNYCVNNTLADVDGEWSQWSAWTDCSSSCTGGIKQRTRACNDPLPACNGLPCVGESAEEISCNANVTCCDVGAYSQWSECSATCGDGIQTRTRSYVNGSMAAVCNISLEDTKSCNFGDCNITCEMSDWSEWSSCSASCGTGTMFRTRGITTPAPDCPDNSKLDSGPCYEQDCPCEDNQVWSNTSLCQRTCTERFGDFNDTLCTIESEGCVCEADLYLDETGTCVNTSECDKCYVNGTEWIPGEVYDDDEDPCYSCQCVGGEVICDRKCPIPTCADNEILSYDVPNTCCPICVPQEDTCRKYTRKEVLRDEASQCVSVGEVTVDYCAGSCGNSTSFSILMISELDDRQDADCHCCTAITGSLEEIPVVCGPDQIQKTAYIAKISECTCNVCLNTGSQTQTRR